MAPADLPGVLSLLHRELGWPADGTAEMLWRWKHEANPFGASTCWVGVEASEVIAVRVFMRWALVDHAGVVHQSARAVDTATHPGHRRRGWFRRLTTAAMEELAAHGVSLLFNTPNAQSLPANESLGWVEQPRPTVWVRPSRPSGLLRLARSRTSAGLWPEPTAVGCDAEQAWARPEVASLLGAPRLPESGALITAHSEATLRWRYGLPALGYRFVGDGDGIVVVRTRRRGMSLERALLDSWGSTPAWRAALSDRQAFDHAISLGARPGRGWWRLPAAGPRVVARPMQGSSLPGHLGLVLGDVELL